MPAHEIPERLNVADWFLDARLREGQGDRTAVIDDDGEHTYADVRELANRWGNLLRGLGVQPEQRVIVALRDSVDFVGALFGILKIGAVVVMVNPDLAPEAIRYFYDYTRATVALVDVGVQDAFELAAGRPTAPDEAPLSEPAPHLDWLLVRGDPEVDLKLRTASRDLETFPSHRDDPAIWLFSGGTTGHPKAVVQPHRSYVNSTLCYGHGCLGIGPDDVTISVPKLFFGYATGSNLLFPFSVGGATVLFRERCTPEALFDRIERHRPTILVNVPTMIAKMLDHPRAEDASLSSLRLATSAGEALPTELHQRWDAAFDVPVLDGLGTAEQWHIFLSNFPDDVRPGTLGRPVPGFEVRICDDDGTELPDGEVGWLQVAGDSRAIAYWQHHDKSLDTFRGRWVVTGDMLRRDPDGSYVYEGRGDDMLKVSGKWLSPGEVENCLLEHDAVAEVAVVGVETDEALVKPKAFVVAADGHAGDGELAAALQDWVKERLEPYKYPRQVEFLDELPRTHLGKVDRGELKGRG